MRAARLRLSLVVLALSELLGGCQVVGDVSFFGPTICNDAELISLQVFIAAFFVFAALCLVIFWCRCIVLARDIRYKKFAWMHTEKMKHKVYERRGNELICWFLLIPCFLAACFTLVALFVNCSNRTPAPVMPSPAPTLSPTIPTNAPTSSPASSPSMAAAVPTTVPTNTMLGGNMTSSNTTNSTNSSLPVNMTMIHVNMTDTNITNTNVTDTNMTTGLNETMPSTSISTILNETSGDANTTTLNTSEVVGNVSKGEG